MKLFCFCVVTSIVFGVANGYAEPVTDLAKAVPNGLTIPDGYKNWKLVSVSERKDKNSLRAILGNYKAHKASIIDGKWNWPEGSILAKLAWENSVHPDWPDAIVPGKLTHIEFMFKDEKKFAATGGWGFARWVGMKLEPYANDGSECFACHSKVQANGYVFTRPATLP